ncbi:hypothetical protein [Nocardia sp. NPDC004260]
MSNGITRLLRQMADGLGVWIPRGGEAAARPLKGANGLLVESVERFTEVDSRGLSPTSMVAEARQVSSAGVQQVRYVASAREQTMQARRLLKPSRRGGAEPRIKEEHSNDVYLLRSTDGDLNIYKPISGENLDLTVTSAGSVGIPKRPGEYAKREVAAFRVDEALGFGLVPPTAMVRGPKGWGSVQQFVPSTGARNPTEYPKLQQQRMAAFDYIIGNTDRHPYGNFRTDLNGNIVAIDHGLAFPETPEFFASSLDPFGSRYQGIPFDSEVLDAVRAVDPAHVRVALNDLKLRPSAVDRVIDRLTEVQQHGRIPPGGFPKSFS